MTQTAIVLLVRDTGSVLATVTRAGDPASAPPAADLAGARFPVRDSSGRAVVELAAEELDSKAVPLIDDLLLNPQECGVHDDAAGLLGGTAPTLSLTPTGVEVSAAVTVSDDTPVWVQLESGAGQTRRRDVLTGKILKGEKNVTLAKTLPAGAYDVLGFVAGQLGRLQTGVVVP